MAQRYTVLTGMAYPTDDATAQLLVDATVMPDGERQELVARLINSGAFRVVEVGEIVDDIRPESAGWLLEQGHIERYAISEDAWRDLGRPETE